MNSKDGIQVTLENAAPDLDPATAIKIVARYGYRAAVARLGHPRSTLFDLIHKDPDNLRIYAELRVTTAKKSARTKSDVVPTTKDILQIAPNADALTEPPSTDVPLTVEAIIDKLDIKFHPATEIFSLPTIETVVELAAKIKKEGLRDPIDLIDGMIVHGRGRALACYLAETELKHRVIANIDEPYRYLIAAHDPGPVSKSSLACCAVLAMKYHDEAARKRQLAGLRRGTEQALAVGTQMGQRTTEGRSSQIVADLFHVSRELVVEAKRLRLKSPKDFAKVHAGLVTLSKFRKSGTKVSTPDAATKVEEKLAMDSSPIKTLLDYVVEHRKKVDTLTSAKAVLVYVEDALRAL